MGTITCSKMNTENIIDSEVPPFDYTIYAGKKDFGILSLWLVFWFTLYYLVNKYIEKPNYYQIQEEKLASETIAETNKTFSTPETPLDNSTKNNKPMKFTFWRFKLYSITAINAWVTFFAGIYYAIVYGIRGDQWNNTFETCFSTMQVAYFLYDIIVSRIHKTDDKAMLVHHIMSGIGYGTPFLFHRWGSFAIYGMFVGEFSAPCLINRDLFPVMDNAKLSRIFYGRKENTDEAEQKKQADNIR